MKMYYVYVLYSETHRKFYTGMTSNIEQRLSEHNRGKSKFTASYKPWKLVYQEGPYIGDTARKKEKYLKSAAGKRFIRSHFHSSNRGSLPD